MKSLVALWREGLADASTVEAARAALAYFDELYPAPRVRRVGMDTFSALVIRCHLGRSPAEAAAREYVYRWNLALRSPCFGVPHLLGA